MITSIKKRDGREIHFSPEKITRAIFLAASRVAQEEGSKADYETAEILTEKVVNLLNNTYQGTFSTVGVVPWYVLFRRFTTFSVSISAVS